MTTLPLAPATASDILEIVAAYFGLKVKDMIGPRNLRMRAHGRHVVMHLLRRNTNCSLEEIAIIVGRTHHTTAIHGLRVIAGQLERDTDGILARQILELERQLRWKKIGHDAAALLAEETFTDAARSVKTLTPPAKQEELCRS